MDTIDRWGSGGHTLTLKRDRGLLDDAGRARIIFSGEAPGGGRGGRFNWTNLQSNYLVAPLAARLEHWKDAAERERLQLETERQANLAGEGKLQRENDELAKGVLDLTRRLTIAEQRTKHAEQSLLRSMEATTLWRTGFKELCRSQEKLSRRVAQELGEQAAGGHLLPLAYFPAGEEPGARWGLSDLGQQAVDSGRVKGPEWTLLVSPDPREVLSIEVRAGSRQEEIYRSAGYVTAEEPDIKGGHFLGLLEAFAQVAAAEDEAMGRAMAALEGLFLFGQQERAAECLEVTEIAAVPPGERWTPESYAAGLKAMAASAGRLLARDLASAPTKDLLVSWPPYDLAAVCARCSRPYGEHVLPAGPECDGFVAEAPYQPGLTFLCAACMKQKPLSERAPSTMPLCQDCWRKDP